MLIKIIVIIFIAFLIIKIITSLLNIKILKYIFTPLTTLSVMAVPLYLMFYNHNQYAVLITAGLIFSLIGDIFNMLEEGDQYNLQFGMFFFIFTHIIYILAFLKGYGFQYYQIAVIIILLVILLLLHILFNKNYNQLLIKLLIAPYMLLVSGTMIAAIGNLSNGITIYNLLITIGSILFWLSDLILGFDAFFKKIKFNIAIVWGLYAPAQMLIALSCLYY